MTPTEEQNLAIAEWLGCNGASIAITYAGNREKAKAVVETIKKNGMHAIAIQANLSHTDEITKLFNAAQWQFGSLSILVNSAGTGVGGTVAETDEAAFDNVFELNVKGTFFCMKQAANRLNLNWRIMNISSGLVVRPTPEFSLYCASKAAIERMGKVLSMEVSDRGITVNTVSPGPTDTEIFGSLRDDSKTAAERSPFNRLGQSEDIADVIAFVMSNQCRWMIGHTFQVGGGYV